MRKKILWHLIVTRNDRMLKDIELTSSLEYNSQIFFKLFAETKRLKLFFFPFLFFLPATPPTPPLPSWSTKESAKIHIHLQGKKYALLSATGLVFFCRRDLTETVKNCPLLQWAYQLERLNTYSSPPPAPNVTL